MRDALAFTGTALLALAILSVGPGLALLGDTGDTISVLLGLVLLIAIPVAAIATTLRR